jgi:hypothetical protein
VESGLWRVTVSLFEPNLSIFSGRKVFSCSIESIQ